MNTVIYNVFLAVSLTFACLALWLSSAAYRKSPRGQTKRLEDCEDVCSDLEMRLASLQKSHKRLNSRISMQIARDAKKTNDEADTEMKSGESPQEWKMRMRKLIAQGKLKQTFDDEAKLV